MMEQKAFIFMEMELAKRIMQMEDPGAMKRAGQQIKNFDQETWERVACDIVPKGNTHKFAQNAILFKALTS